MKTFGVFTFAFLGALFGTAVQEHGLGNIINLIRTFASTICGG